MAAGKATEGTAPEEPEVDGFVEDLRLPDFFDFFLLFWLFNAASVSTSDFSSRTSLARCSTSSQKRFPKRNP